MDYPLPYLLFQFTPIQLRNAIEDISRFGLEELERQLVQRTCRLTSSEAALIGIIVAAKMLNPDKPSDWILNKIYMYVQEQLKKDAE